MGFESFWLQFNNGKKEQLGDTKSGIRKEQVDKKFHNLFDAYDTNNSEVLESGELEGIFKTLSVYAGNDKILDNNENKLIASIFGANTNVQDIDFQGFVRSVSNASADIVESKETQLEDGGKEIFTIYKDGTKETVGYYPSGEFKYKKTEKMLSETHYYVEINGQKQEVDKQNYELALKRMEEMQAQQNKPKMTDGYQFNLPSLMPDVKISSQTEERPDIKYEFSGRAYLDIQARDFLLTHFIETHYGTQDALDTMGILDDIGAAINAGAGELWNACVNIYNKHFGNGTEEDYKNFYDLVKKFEPQYDQAVLMKPQAEAMQRSPELYFKNFETDYENKTGNKYNLQEVMQFQQLAEQYQVASVLSMRMDCLKKALNEVRMYQSTQDALTYNSVQSEGMNPAQHLLNAQEYLLQYFNNDEEAANLVLNGTIGNADKTLEAINSLISETELQLKDALNKKELVIKTDNDSLEIKAELFGSENYANFEELKAEYQKSYKAMYGTDFVPDELTDKVMGAKATGGFVKIAAITIVSILITKSPVMANIMKASAGAVVDGASANFIRGLVSKYGQTVVQQGIKFAMSTGTLATDVGLTLLNQVTDNREGINGEEVWETTKGAAKYIYFGAFVGSPIAQAVTQKVGKLGIAGKLFVNGTKTTQGAITTTTITGEQLVQNFMKASQSIVAKGAGFATDIAAFTLLDITTEDITPGEALTSQAEMLTGLRVMHKAFEYMLGGRTHTAIQKANWEAAIEKSGVKNWNIKEIKTPTADGKGFKVVYDVDFNGIPLGKMHDANALITAMMGKVSETYQAMETERSTKPKTETSKNEEVIIQEICDKYKDLSDKELQAEIIRETALGNDEKVSELIITFTQRGHKVSFADSEGKAVIEKVDGKIDTKFEDIKNLPPKFRPMEIEVGNLYDNNIRSAYSDKKFPLYTVKGIDVEFSEKSGAKRLKRSKLPKSEPVILVSQVGTNAGTSTLDKTLFTYEMIECAALAIVDRTNNRQTLIHVNPGLSVDANKAIIKHILSESNPKEVEISVVHGDSERTFGTVQFILDTIEEIAPTNKVNLYNFDKLGKYGGVILKNGELTCCDVNKPTLDNYKNIQINPKDNITRAVQKQPKVQQTPAEANPNLLTKVNEPLVVQSHPQKTYMYEEVIATNSPRSVTEIVKPHESQRSFDALKKILPEMEETTIAKMTLELDRAKSELGIEPSGTLRLDLSSSKFVEKAAKLITRFATDKIEQLQDNLMNTLEKQKELFSRKDKKTEELKVNKDYESLIELINDKKFTEALEKIENISNNNNLAGVISRLEERKICFYNFVDEVSGINDETKIMLKKLVEHEEYTKALEKLNNIKSIIGDAQFNKLQTQINKSILPQVSSIKGLEQKQNAINTIKEKLIVLDEEQKIYDLGTTMPQEGGIKVGQVGENDFYFISNENIKFNDIEIPNTKGRDIAIDAKNQVLNLSSLYNTPELIPNFIKEIRKNFDIEAGSYYDAVLKRIEKLGNPKTSTSFNSSLIELMNVTKSLKLDINKTTKIKNKTGIPPELKEKAYFVCNHLNNSKSTIAELFYDENGLLIGKFDHRTGNYVVFDPYMNFKAGTVYDSNGNIVRTFDENIIKNVNGEIEYTRNNKNPNAENPSPIIELATKNIQTTNKIQSLEDLSCFNRLKEACKQICEESCNIEEAKQRLNKIFQSIIKEKGKEFEELDELIKAGHALTIDFGIGKNGEFYIGSNRFHPEGINNEIDLMHGYTNKYGGKCAETSLKIIAGEELNGCTVYDIRISHVHEEHGLFQIDEHIPCETCTINTALWNWKYPKR